MSKPKICIVIPCYNHGTTVPGVVSKLREYNLAIIIVDDGSNDKKTGQILSQYKDAHDITLITLTVNSGKGGAFLAGLKEAKLQGYTNVLQIDADGQHDLSKLSALIMATNKHPQHLISGQPQYDESLPLSRKIGREITHFWVKVETLSTSIKDTMCGFRSYPVNSTLATCTKYKIGSYMDFDIDIMVHMYWDGVAIDFIPVGVIYPEDGVSHFNAWLDNLRISKMHTRLVFGMLPRSLSLIRRNLKVHWSSKKERGTKFGIKILLYTYTKLGRGFFRFLLRFVMLYYYLTAKDVRIASAEYLKQIKETSQDKGNYQHKDLTTYKHLLSFGETLLDKLAAWRGDYSLSDLNFDTRLVKQLIDQKQGIFILGSHLGNLELCRALAHEFTNLKINALVFTENAVKFNEIITQINPNSALNLIQVTTIDPSMAILLQQKLDAGEWVVIVGDRTSITQEERVIWSDFLGKKAPFAQGPFIMASVLHAPVYTLFGLRNDFSDKNKFNVYLEHFTDNIRLNRQKRNAQLTTLVDLYAKRLEQYCLEEPLQWYNFYPFWQLSESKLSSQDQDIR